MEKQLKPFDKVLYLDEKNGIYRPSIVSCCTNDGIIMIDGTQVPESNVVSYEQGTELCGAHIGNGRKLGQTYYSVTMFGTIEEYTDDLDLSDDELYEYGNYFLDVNDARKMRDKIKELLK